MKLVYVAGPFRGKTPLDVRRNVERARDLGLKVAQCGAYPVIPHTMTADFDKQLTDQFWLDGTMALLERCDAIILTEHWETSVGAQAERQRACELNLRVFYTDQTAGWPRYLADWAREIPEPRGLVR